MDCLQLRLQGVRDRTVWGNKDQDACLQFFVFKRTKNFTVHIGHFEFL